MIRTQVYIPEDLYYHIQLLTQLQKKPAAEVIRDLLTEGFHRQAQVQKTNAGDALLRIAKIGAKGPKDLSVNHDKYLYEK